MPWSAGDAKKHKKGLSKEQAKKWAKIANKVLKDCRDKGGKDCEAKAIRVANSKFTEGSMKQTRKVPNSALYFKEPGHFEFAEEDGKKTFSMLAYSGKPIKGHWMWGDLAIDVMGMEFGKRAFPILEEHMRDKKIGFSKKKPSVENNALEIEEIELLSNPDAEVFYENAKNGFPYEASISVRPSVIEEIGEGQKAEVNGYTMKGPATIFRKGHVREASVCTFGYDNKTSVSVFNDSEEKELDLEILNQYDNNNAKQSDAELNDGSSEGDDNNGQGGNKMTLEELRQQHPELVAEIEKAAKKPLQDELAEKDRKITVLEDTNQQLSDTNKTNESRIADLEKSEAIRTERELSANAEGIFAAALSNSKIPARLHSKVRAQVRHDDFVEEGVLDEAKFKEAIANEIKSWETDLAAAYKKHDVVLGMTGGGDNEATGDSTDKNDRAEKLSDRLVGYITNDQK